MADERALTPSTTTRSRDSSMILDKLDRDTPASLQTPMAMTPSSSIAPLGTHESGPDAVQTSMKSQPETKGVESFKPYQSLMETEIAIEYGKKLKGKRVIHQELLCCHSEQAQWLFKDATQTRQAYSSADDLRKQLKGFVYPQVSEKAFDETHGEKKAVPLIVLIYERYPLNTHCERIQQTVDEVVTEQVAKRNVIAPQSKTVLQKKDLKSMGIQARLKGLQSKGVFAVAQRLSGCLRHIKHNEKQAAKSDRAKAAAQQRIILPHYNDREIKSLVQWCYCPDALSYEDAEHLYSLHALATEMGITSLAQQCLTLLSNETDAMIQTAISKGETLDQLLDLTPKLDDKPGQSLIPGNMVQVVFSHVLEDDTSHKRLVDLVVTRLAEQLNTGMWEKLACRVNLKISVQLIKAMLQIRQIKIEKSFGLEPK